MTTKPVALTIAGSDSGGGAGVQADLKTMEALDVFGTSAVTSLTAQNTTGVRAVEDADPETVAAQIDAVCEDFDVGAAKTGMLSDAAIVEAVADRVAAHELDLVVDPVMVAQSGDRLLDEDAESTLRDELVPLARLVTPNVPEAAILSGLDVHDEATMETAARKIASEGAEAALVTGGHAAEDAGGERGGTDGADEGTVVDVLYDAAISTYQKERVGSRDTHGSGCTLSAAIAAELARGDDLKRAVGTAEELLHRAVVYGYEMGEGAGSVNHTAGLHDRAARRDALDGVRRVVGALEDRGEAAATLIPEVGTNVAVATPYALDQDEVAAVEGRVHRTVDGVAATRGPRAGASGHVARYLLAVREVDRSVRAACNLRNAPRVRDVVEDTMDTASFDRTEEPDDAPGTMEYSVEAAMRGRDDDGYPTAVVDPGAHGKEPMIRLTAESPSALVDRVTSLIDALGTAR